MKPESLVMAHQLRRREYFGIERNQSFKESYDNAQFSHCCTSTAMPDSDSQDRHPAFFFGDTARAAHDICPASTFATKRAMASPTSISPKIPRSWITVEENNRAPLSHIDTSDIGIKQRNAFPI